MASTSACADDSDGDDAAGETGGDPTGGDPAEKYLEPGPNRVGYQVLQHPREDGAELEIKAWYPAEGEPDESVGIEYLVELKFPGFPPGLVPILGNADQGATQNAGSAPYPLVVLSHGYLMNPEWYHVLAEHLASHGFVVLGPEHIESDWATGIVAASVSRPADVSATIDFAETGPLSSIIDSEQVAVIGHSYGGYTSLAVAGAQVYMPDLVARCEAESDPGVTGFFCDPFIAGQEELATLMGLDSVPQDLWPPLVDTRVDAIVPMAGDAYLFGETGLASISVPALMLGGTADTGTLWDWGAKLAFDSVSSETAQLASFMGAEHFIPACTCDDMPWTEGLPPEATTLFCEDPGWEKAEALPLINQIVTAFLSHTLRNDPDAAAALDPELYEAFAGLSLEGSI